MKYIVCNSEVAVLNRVYDELEKYIEDGAVLSLPYEIINTQIEKRIILDYNLEKFRYKHIIFLAQKEIFGIDIEEDKSIYRLMKKNLYKKLDADNKNIYFPQITTDDNVQENLEKYDTILQDNKSDVTIIFLDNEGKIFGYDSVTCENKLTHVTNLAEKERNILKNNYNINAEKIINVGIENLLASRNLFLIAVGNDKKEYIKNILENDEESNNILQVIKNHPALTVFVDKEASYKSEEEVTRLLRRKQKQKELEELKKLEEKNKEEKGE